MKKVTNIFVTVFGLTAIILGIEQLSYKNTIFADTLARCCETSQCDAAPCNSLSGIKLKENNCRDSTYTCKDCMDFIRLNQECVWPSSTYKYCKLPNGHRYSTFYGEEFPPPSITINGPTSLQYGVNGTFTASVTDGTSPFHYQWYYLYPNPNYSPALSGIKPNLRQYDTWYTLGTDSPTLITTFVIDAELKCVVTDARSNTATSNIMYIHIIMSKVSANVSANYELEKETVNVFALMQNYPNPFNPSTIIRYSIKEPSVVYLRIYDALGKEIRELVRERKEPGIYTVEFNASKLPSGIYFYTLTTNNFSDTKKMFLIK
ncbi:MAG: T9SS type A sorting domain-containing protein [Ignavibacteriaceae bacterium]